MNKYLVCHSHISVEPEAIGVDKLLSFTEMESVLNEDCVLIVSDIVHASLTATYIKNVQKDPSCVYGLSGLWIDVTDKNIENCTTVVKFDRSFSGQRYTTLDYGNQLVHVFDKPSYALNPSKVKIRPIDNCYLFSSELEKAGVSRVVVDTKLWGGPRINMPRFTTFNFKAALFRSLASTEWKVLPRPEDKEEEDEAEGIMPDPLEQKEYNFDGLPDVMVMITTHNRTETALKTIESLVKHLRYPKLKWCICDDRSEEGHVAKLADKFFELGIEDIKICRTSDERWGLGASMNNGLRACYDVGPVAFTTEDDWLLKRDLDITDWVKILIEDPVASVIRLGLYWEQSGVFFTKSKHNGLMEFNCSERTPASWVINNQVAIRHRRVYDLIGLYVENTTPDEAEQEFRTRFNKKAKQLKVFWPENHAIGTEDDPSLPFLHFGKSTLGHSWNIPKKLNDDIPFFRIITPVYNSGQFLYRCMKSVEKQTFKNFVWILVDDCSTDNSYDIIKKISAGKPWIIHKQLKRNSGAGGARNIAATLSNSEYTLYLDSDDYLFDEYSLQNVYDSIIQNGMPDAVRLFRKDSSGIDDRAPKTVAELVKLNVCPWQLCHKTSLQQKFVPDRRKNDDVVWFYRTCDHIKTVGVCKHPVCVYTTENPLSAQNGNKGRKDRKALAGDYYVIADLLCETFNNDCVQNAVTNFMRAMNTVVSRYTL